VKKITSILLSSCSSSVALHGFAVPQTIPADTKAAVAKGGVQVTIFGDLVPRTFYKKPVEFTAM
jgi:hypothetical protein